MLLRPRPRDVVGRDGEAYCRRPVAGDLAWRRDAWHRWDGRVWRRAAYSLRPRLLLDPAGPDRWQEASDSQRVWALDQAVADQVLSHGATLRWRSGDRAVVGTLVPVSHLAHLLASVVTAGLWLVVWLVMVLSRRERRLAVEVDRWGHVWRTPGTEADVALTGRTRTRTAA